MELRNGDKETVENVENAPADPAYNPFLPGTQENGDPGDLDSGMVKAQ